MGKTTLAGHPLHPQLIVAPAALLPFSAVLDAIHSATGEESYADAAYYSMVGGYSVGLAAAAAGAADYLTIPSGTETKKVANLHGALNLGLLGLYSVNLLMRRTRRAPGKLPKILSLIGTAGLLVSAWYGGELAYTHGVRVKGVSPTAGAPETKLPGDEAVAQAFEEAGRSLAPSEGPGEGGPDDEDGRAPSRPKTEESD